MTLLDRSPLSRTEFHFKFQKIQNVLKMTLKVSIQLTANQGLVTNHIQDNIVFKKRIQLSAISLLANGWQVQSYIFIWYPLDKIVCPASRSELLPFDLNLLYCWTRKPILIKQNDVSFRGKHWILIGFREECFIYIMSI